MKITRRGFLQGAIGLAQIEKLDEIHIKRMESKRVIGELLKKYCNVYVPEEFRHAQSSWFGTPIVCKDKSEKNEFKQDKDACKKIETPTITLKNWRKVNLENYEPPFDYLIVVDVDPAAP